MIRTWRRHRRSRPAMDPRHQGAAWQCISLLLEYPEPELMERLDLISSVAAELPAPVGTPLATLVTEMKARDLRELQTLYVDTFDVTRKCSLHLTYFTDGDTRKRGVSLVQFKQAYRRGGVDLADEQAELPDHLCVLLEFGAAHDPEAAWRLLNDHRVGIELLNKALEQRTSPWRYATQALRATLPDLGEDDVTALRRLIAEGPPTEQVGLDSAPYAAFDPALDEPAQRHPLAVPHQTTPPAGVRATGRVADLGATINIGAPR